MRTLPLVLIASLCGSACSYNRVALRPVPEATAPEAQRVRAFRELAPQSGLATSYFQNGAYQGTYINWLTLGDGTRVEDPRDLLPAVEPTSPTARYATTFEEKTNAARGWSTAAWVGMSAGLVTMLVPLFIPRDYSSLSSGMSPMLVGLAAGGGIELLSLVPMMIGMFKSSSAQADRVSAFETYPRSLQQRLALEEQEEEAPATRRRQDAQLKIDRPLRLLTTR